VLESRKTTWGQQDGNTSGGQILAALGSTCRAAAEATEREGASELVGLRVAGRRSASTPRPYAALQRGENVSDARRVGASCQRVSHLVEVVVE
jgi:hypothetical protein